MLEHSFEYNLPADNHIFNYPDTLIKVDAFYLGSTGTIAIEFPKMGLGSVLSVKNWFKAADEIRSLAATEFQQILAVEEANQLTAV